MNIESKKIDGILIAIPKEKQIDASIAKIFKGKMIDFINEGNNKIIVDLSNVDFIDSSGLNAILSSFKALDKDGRLILCNVQKRVLSLFELTKMNRVLKIFSSIDEAIKAV
ncbi:MAG: STAS domain-containing protein [Desulfobacterales bacterium]|nr:STAS domain-containing protein [Desulfobacterales bacterium]